MAALSPLDALGAIGFTALFVLAAFFPGSSFSFSNWLGLLFVLVPLVIFGSLVFAQVYRYPARLNTCGTPADQMDRLRRGSCAAGFLLLGVLLPAFSAVVHCLCRA